jgi:hypothetical protein
MSNSPFTSLLYLAEDYPRTLFPLSTTSVIAASCGQAVLDFVYQKILTPGAKDYAFHSQQRVYAAKKGFHLRRTVKLDPIAEIFLYDIAFRNRSSFTPIDREGRAAFGYRFDKGRPVSPTHERTLFSRAVARASKDYKHHIAFDIATYFNSIYHHDLVNHFRGRGWSADDVGYLGRFLREITAGRSIDCLPHGLHPSKMIGSDFLRYVDESHRVRSPQGLRFLDDFHLFNSDLQELTRDFLAVQELLGEKGLSLNASKTVDEGTPNTSVAETVDEMRSQLLEIRTHLIMASGDLEEEEEPEEIWHPLDEPQVDYLLGLLNDPDIEETDAELVLILLRDHGDEVLPKMMSFLNNFPGLSKNLYQFIRFLSDRSGADETIASFVNASPLATEYQLFWLAKVAEDYFSASSHYGDLLWKLYQHPNATTISKAKVLEIPEQQFGLPELRQEHLRTGKSDWLAWAAAAGCRLEPAASRNHVLGYFANGSPLNRVIADCIRSLP